MRKRILAIVLAIVLVLSMGVVAASAAEADNTATGASQVIRFDAGKWSNFKAIYCHVWVNGGASFFAWKGGESQCKKLTNTIYEYDLANLAKSTAVEGGFKSGRDYCVIFHADTGVQTYDLTLGTECVGDTAKITGNMIENPVDSEKKTYEAVWNKNSGKYGPHRAITSIGSFVGSKLCPNENGAKVIAEWCAAYPSASNYCKPEEVIAEAMKEFKVKDIQTIYTYFLTIEDTMADQATVLKYLEDAAAIAYPNQPKETINVDDAKNNATSPTLNDAVNKAGNQTSNNGGSSNGGSTVNNSGSGADGQNDTIVFVLCGVMILAIGVLVVARKKREE